MRRPVVKHVRAAERIKAVKALRRWPRLLALSMNRACEPTVTWEEWCKAQDDYEAVLAALQDCLTDAAIGDAEGRP